MWPQSTGLALESFSTRDESLPASRIENPRPLDQQVFDTISGVLETTALYLKGVMATQQKPLNPCLSGSQRRSQVRLVTIRKTQIPSVPWGLKHLFSTVTTLFFERGFFFKFCLVKMVYCLLLGWIRFFSEVNQVIHSKFTATMGKPPGHSGPSWHAQHGLYVQHKLQLPFATHRHK